MVKRKSIETVRKPNFIYIGPNKAGSTWVYEALRLHPEILMAPAKELHYFDIYYSQGPEWYFGHFKDALPSHKIVAEVSHDYMYSEEACERIINDIGRIPLMVSLRNPVERSFSEYLYLIKQGYVTGSFEDALEARPAIIDHSMYGKHLLRYKHAFGLENLIVTDFAFLKSDPAAYYLDLCGKLGISQTLPAEFPEGEVLSAAAPRNFLMARLAKEAAMFMRRQGWATQIRNIKSAPLLQKALYRPFAADDKPVISPETRARLKQTFADDVRLLDRELGVNFCKVWGYEQESEPEFPAAKVAQA